ncbi:MAG: formate/nitrite transporter family protein [Gaiellaceae bacterium]
MAAGPEEIYARTREEGRRRLERPLLEVVATAFAAGFDIVAGVAFLAVVAAGLRPHFGTDAAHVGGGVVFGVGFVFLIVGRGELFTENFLVPLAGLDGKEKSAWRKLAELWTVSPLFNIAGGGLVAVLLTVHGVLPEGSGHAVVELGQKIHANHPLALFVSAIFAGALITAMTWFVEGQESVGVRVAVAWATGSFLALASLNHVIVVTIELTFAIRFGAHIPWIFVVWNFGLAAGGNMLGGIGLVTLTRFAQARAKGGGEQAGSG